MNLIVIALLSLFVIANSQTCKLDSDICDKICRPTVSCITTTNGKCSFIEPTMIAYVTYEQGKALCTAKGGTPGNIYSKAQYDIIWNKMTEISTTINGAYYIWLGMRYSATTSTNAEMYDGSPAPYTRWYAGYPTGAYGASQLQLVADPGNLPKNHMNSWTSGLASDGRLGILCERPL